LELAARSAKPTPFHANHPLRDREVGRPPIGRAAEIPGLRGLAGVVGVNHDITQASSAVLVRKILQVLDVLKGSPAGAVIYRQVEQLLAEAQDAHLGAERAYAGMLYALLDAYAQHLPLESPLYVQVKMLQERLQPPMSPLDVESLRDQVEGCADHLVRLRKLDRATLARVLAPLFEASEPVDAPPPTPSPSTDDGIPEPPSSADEPIPPAEEDERLRHTVEVQQSLSREIRETIAQNEEFGVMLDLVTSELDVVTEARDLESVRRHLREQVRRLHGAHYRLAEKLDSADRYLGIIEQGNQQLSKELNRARLMSMTDELTGLPNRRAFVNRLADEVARVQRYGSLLSLAIIDLDRFKGINDRYGHPAGDVVLRCYADEIFSVFRHHDLVARYGGEEFAVLFPNTGSEGAERALHKVRARCAKFICYVADAEIPLPSFSAGLATYISGETPQAFIERTDHALYRAKRLGRDRIEVQAGSQENARDGEESPTPEVRGEPTKLFR